MGRPFLEWKTQRREKKMNKRVASCIQVRSSFRGEEMAKSGA